MLPDPARTGRSVVVGPDEPPPAAWDGCERIAVRAVDAAVADELGAAWRARRPVVIELGPGLGLDDPALPPPEVHAGRQPWELEVGLDLTGERLHHAVWANAADARAGIEPVFRWEVEAAALGADLDDVVVDGGPLDVDLPGRLGRPVLHRISIEHRSVRPLGPNTTTADLAPDQLAAVTHPGAGARIIAPAGSGKTRVLTERARTLLGSWGVPAGAIAVVAYNRRAAEELRARTTDLDGLRIRTLNALSLRLLPAGVRTIEERQVRVHLERLIDLPRRAETDPAAPWIDALGQVRLGLRHPLEVEAELQDVSDLERVARDYRARLRDAGEVDFDEQVVAAIERLLTDPPFRWRAQRFARLLLVDEFQDLTPAHVLLLRLLAGPAGSVFGVGDDDQTIYGYAGATPRWLVDFATEFPGSGDHPLEVNYRCPPAVVAAASNLLTRNALRVPKSIRPAPTATDGPGAFEVATPSEDPAAVTARRVRALVDGGASPADIAVLTRVNSSLAPVQVLLRADGLPVQGGVDERFLQRSGVRAALAWLALADAPEQALPERALREACRRPKRGFSDRVRSWIAEQRSPESLARLAARLNKASDARRVEEFATDVVRVRVAASKGGTAEVLRVVREQIGGGGLDASAAALDGWSHGAVASHGDDLDTLASLAHLEPRPGRFEAWLGDALATGDDADGVTLKSIHAVKGQEWPHVVVHHVSAGILPHRLVDDEEEERRVLHVGITRGRTTVTVVSGPVPSTFLRELAAPGEPKPKRVVRSSSAPAPSPASGRVDPKATRELSVADEAVFEQLREWRRRRADGKPAYTVFSDATLRDLAAAKPTTEAGLRRVPGVGPTKLELYGDDLLTLFAELTAS